MRYLGGIVLMLALQSPAAPPDLTTVEQRVIELSNQVRAANGLGPLTDNNYLDKAARGHSEEMAKLNYFDHESPNVARRYPWDRVNQLGVDADGISENLYLSEGYSLVQIAAMAVKSWENSPDHRHNLLDPAKTNIGVGVAIHGSQVYVTQVFSSPVGPLAP